MRRAFNQIKGKVQGVKKILKNYLGYVENIGGFGCENNTRKRVNWGQNFHEDYSVQNSTKLMEN